MPVTIARFPIRTTGLEDVIVTVKLTVGDTGAVSAISGRGFPTTSGGANGGDDHGDIVKESADGQYTITLPGRGALADVVVQQPVIEDATDVFHATVISKDLSARQVVVQFWDADTPAAGNLTSGTIVHFTFVAKNSDIG